MVWYASDGNGQGSWLVEVFFFFLIEVIEMVFGGY